MIDLSGKVALVTGAARGIGRASAVALAEAGADVVLVDLDRQVDGPTYQTAGPDDLAQTAALVEAAGSCAVIAFVDVRDHAGLTQAVSRLHERFGRLDLVVANAGVAKFGLVRLLKSLPEALDVGHAQRWLCSDKARYITSSRLVVDAGATPL